MVGHTPRHPEELHNITLEGIYDRRSARTAGRPRNSYIGQIKCDARVKTFKELKEKAINRSGWRIGVVKKNTLPNNDILKIFRLISSCLYNKLLHTVLLYADNITYNKT